MMYNVGFLCMLMHTVQSSASREKSATHSFTFDCPCVQCADVMSAFHEGLFQIYYGLGHPSRGFCCTKDWKENRAAKTATRRIARSESPGITDVRERIQRATTSLKNFWTCSACSAEVLESLKKTKRWPCPKPSEVMEALKSTKVINFPGGQLAKWDLEDLFDGPFFHNRNENGEYLGLERKPEFFDRMDDLILCEESIWSNKLKGNFLWKYMKINPDKDRRELAKMELKEFTNNLPEIDEEFAFEFLPHLYKLIDGTDKVFKKHVANVFADKLGGDIQEFLE